VTQFPLSMTGQAYVDKLFANSGVTPTTSERNSAIAAFGSGDTAGRAAALRSVVESDTVFTAQYNPSFVLMQYYGYLRRNPDDSPDNSFAGYDFWLTKMNSFSVPGENVRDASVALARVRRAEMVRAFIESSEYRERFFGAPATKLRRRTVVKFRVCGILPGRCCDSRGWAVYRARPTFCPSPLWERGRREGLARSTDSRCVVLV
jgi:hypothetical protein